MLHLDTAHVLALVTAYLIPAVAALLTRPKWSVTVTGIISAALAAVSGFVTQWADAPDPSHYNWQAAALTALGALAVTALSHFVTFKGSLTNRLHAVGP